MTSLKISEAIIDNTLSQGRWSFRFVCWPLGEGDKQRWWIQVNNGPKSAELKLWLSREQVADIRFKDVLDLICDDPLVRLNRLYELALASGCEPKGLDTLELTP